ncbi:MAG TPA: hypothetical protein ENK10_08775, partial [Acidobacteria bacterium]|nr:hypothetical protein [Acidobacteriota bacterium]
MAASRVLTLAPEYLSAMAVKLLASPALSTDSQLVIATSRPVARSLLRRSLASGRARVGVRATTLPELAREMAAPRSERRVLPPQTDRLIVAHLLAGDPGPYGPAARRPAVVAAVARALRELREAGMFFLPTEVLPTSIGRRRWERLEHLSRLLEAIDRHLEQHALADDAQVYRAAVGGPIPGRASEALMVGVYDLTGVQKELVADLAARVSLTWLCPLPEEESPSREAIEQTLAWAESRGLAIEAVAIEPPSATPVRVLACPGQRAEAREVARGVLAAAEAGVAFGEMAVLLATSASQGPVFREEFCRAGIPLVGDGKQRLGETPGGRVVAAVAAALAGEAGESEVATIVGALAAAEDLMPSYRALAVLRAAGVRRLEQVPDRLGRLAEQYTGDTAALEALVRLVGRWLKAAAHLERGLEQAFVAASWPSAAHALVVFVEALGWPEGLRSELRRAASELAALESLGVAPRPEMVIDVWRQRCEDLEVDAPPGAEQRGLGEGVLLVEWNRA